MRNVGRILTTQRWFYVIVPVRQYDFFCRTWYRLSYLSSHLSQLFMNTTDTFTSDRSVRRPRIRANSERNRRRQNDRANKARKKKALNAKQHVRMVR